MGAAHTWAVFSEVCDPQHPDFALALRGGLGRLQAAARQDGADGTEKRHWPSRLRRATAVAGWMLRLLPDVYLTGRAWKQGGNPQVHLQQWAAPARGRLDLEQQGYIVSAARWWARLLYPKQAQRGVCVPRAYTTFRALRRYGHPAVFVSGVARSAAGLTSHAWVEDDRGVMEVYGEPLVRLRFTESFRYPAGEAG